MTRGAYQYVSEGISVVTWHGLEGQAWLVGDPTRDVGVAVTPSSGAFELYARERGAAEGSWRPLWAVDDIDEAIRQALFLTELLRDRVLP